MTTRCIIQLGGPRFGDSRPKASYIHVRTILNSKKTKRQCAASQIHCYVNSPPLQALLQPCIAPTRVASSFHLCARNTRTTELFHEIWYEEFYRKCCRAISVFITIRQFLTTAIHEFMHVFLCTSLEKHDKHFIATKHISGSYINE